MDQVVKRVPSAAPAPASSSKLKGSKPPRNVVKLVVVLVVAVVLVGGGLLAISQALTKKTFASEIDSNKYQAVFLTNGQVYFGKIDTLNTNGYKLQDIYYLQVQNGVQPDTTKTADSKDQNLSLAKLGKELHGPEDTMYIESKQVLFWENLKDDSQVVKAIKQDQNK